MDNLGQSVVNPIVQFLTQILDDISNGDLRVPNFQRPYVWKPSDAIALFDSIYKGYPIGSVLFWETTEKLISFNQIGPFKLFLDDRNERNYILDGHQRLSTLYGILMSKKADVDEPHRWVMYFDLDKNEFFFKSSSTKVRNYIAMDKIISTVDFLGECRRIQEDNPLKADYYINKAQKLTQTIVTYKIAITQIKKGDLTSAVEIFSRLNTKGMDMTPDQMLSALTYREGQQVFKLADEIDEILNRLIEYNFSEIERIFIFRSIIAAAKKDIYNVKLEDLANDTKINLENVVDNCADSLIKAARFLREIVKVPSDKFLPYNLQLVFLSEFYFTQSHPTDVQVNELKKWFWFTSYSGWFAGANSSKIRRGLDDIRAFAAGKTESILLEQEYAAATIEMPEKFDFRFARIKAFVLFLNQLNPKSLVFGTENLETSLIEFGPKALHNIFPLEVNSFANKMILGPVRTGFAKSELFRENNFLSEEVLSSHAIPIEALNYLDEGNHGRFLIHRENLLLSLESSFISSFGLNYKTSKSRISAQKDQLLLFSSE